MFVDSRHLPSAAVIDADICIVGAGAAGIVLAMQFIGTGVRVCLLESGGLTHDWQVQALAEGDSVGMRYTDPASCQLRFFGGNTNAWGGWFRGFDAIDFRARPWIADSGWPFGPDTLSPYMRQVHALCEVESDDYSLAAAERIEDERAQGLPFDPERLETVLYRFSPPTRFGEVYRAAIADAEEITCVTHAHALRLEASWNAATVERLEVGRLGMDEVAVRARQFVLAAGAIENARLLLLSDTVAPAGLGNVHDLVGRYFMDHPHTKRALAEVTRPRALGFYGLALRDQGLGAGIALPEEVQERERVLNYKASIYPSYIGQDSAGWSAFVDIALSYSRRWGKDPYNRLRLPFEPKSISPSRLLAILRRPDKVALAALSQIRPSERLVAGFVIESKAEQAPNRDSRVLLQDARDAFGLPRARLDWRLLPVDRRTVVCAEDLIDAELRRLDVGRLAPLPPEQQDVWPDDLAGGWHQMGTTRMHADPRQGVVGADCRVHGCGNLFIAGASVFPTGSAVSPTPMVLALALRLADHLKTELRLKTELGASAAPQTAAPARAEGAHARERAPSPVARTSLGTG